MRRDPTLADSDRGLDYGNERLLRRNCRAACATPLCSGKADEMREMLGIGNYLQHAYLNTYLKNQVMLISFSQNVAKLTGRRISSFRLL